MKKTAILLLLALLITAFTGCGYYSDAEANEIINDLLIRVADLNGYIYGNSFKTEKDPGDDVDSDYQKYYKVATDSKYITLASLVSEVDSLIVSTSREGIYEYAFQGVTDETSASYPPRFAENEDGTLEINVADHMYSLRTKALLGSAKVLRSNPTHIKAKITVYRFTADGTPIEAEKEMELRVEDGEWRLVNQTMIIGVLEEAPAK